MFRADVQGLDRVRAVLGKTIPNAIRAELRRTVYKLAAEVQKHVRDEYLLGPKPYKLEVQTGRLRNNINVKVEETSVAIKATVGTNVFYGVAWELGHVKNWQKKTQPARPFLKPAVEDLRSHIQTRLKMTVDNIVRRGGFFAR
jgi:phage gpG-like protein